MLAAKAAGDSSQYSQLLLHFGAAGHTPSPAAVLIQLLQSLCRCATRITPEAHSQLVLAIMALRWHEEQPAAGSPQDLAALSESVIAFVQDLVLAAPGCAPRPSCPCHDTRRVRCSARPSPPIPIRSIPLPVLHPNIGVSCPPNKNTGF